MVHIGKKIKEVMRAEHYGITEFSKKINKSRSVVYDIFNRESLDSHLLFQICEVLEYNFFSLYNENSEVVNEDRKFYGDGWKLKYFDLLDRHNILLEEKIEDYVKKKST